jgi:hypothetical protein
MVRLVVTVTVVGHVLSIGSWRIRIHWVRSKVLLSVPIAWSILALDFWWRFWLSIICLSLLSRSAWLRVVSRSAPFYQITFLFLHIIFV